MEKKRKMKNNLGKALIRDRFGPVKTRRNEMSLLHTADINDGYDWGRLNLQSVTEESSFQDFLSTAELAGTEFSAEKLNIKFINPKSGIGILSKEEKNKILEVHEEKKSLLKIPRRPKWDGLTTAYELQTKEKEGFLQWRRQLALLQETENLTLTCYEKNLEFWRQLWRVVERSDVIVQIVDARNPLLFRCEDLELYVKEVDSNKMNLILINKADFLTENQRKAWAKYFADNNLRVAFFSATEAVEAYINQEEEGVESKHLEEIPDNIDSEDMNDSDKKKDNVVNEEERNKISNNEESNESKSDVENVESSLQKMELRESTKETSNEMYNSFEILTRDGLISLFKNIYKGPTQKDGVITIGLVGYPNVGKSSTINALFLDKKVSVSATPGKTKHFQTLFLEKDLLLCDCPGLVMPSFVCTKADMILNGILPIDQMRDHVPAVTLLGTLIPRHIIEDLYGIILPLPIEGEDPDRPPTSEEILNTYGYNRGFMTQNGQPDNPRSARHVLKDYVNGKLLYCVAPPTLKQAEFHTFPPRQRIISENRHIPARTLRAMKGSQMTADDVDKVFFQNRKTGALVKGVAANFHESGTNSLNENKPWKKINKHSNKKKREKTRRLFAHLDQH